MTRNVTGPGPIAYRPRGFGHAAARLALVTLAVPAMALPAPSPAAPSPPSAFGPFAKVPVQPGPKVTARPFPPRGGRARCIDITRVAGAQFFGDRAIELTMRDGQRFRMFFARECPALSFYQGFYYPRLNNGKLCAGRDVIGARSGGECPIASILPVRRVGR